MVSKETSKQAFLHSINSMNSGSVIPKLEHKLMFHFAPVNFMFTYSGNQNSSPGLQQENKIIEQIVDGKPYPGSSSKYYGSLYILSKQTMRTMRIL